ncbi:MAG: dipeptide/oligopeptide/nickel ABC transporter permease/ATP-binding protein [Desulfofustis sp.]|jgi:peptide/nickel transport system permease protein|nr:dipeptide/oligopeptide/nickel ABC transporter permease/ATP-binding protein [Desulfofustis sp.]
MTVERKGERKRSHRVSFFALLLRNRLAIFGLMVLSIIVVLCLLAPLLPVTDPDKTDLAIRLQKPFTENHWLGTDHLGRDIWSRILWGTRVSLVVGISASLFAAIIGSLIGILAGYFGGRADNLMMRGIDMLMAFPYILLALAIVAVLGPGLMNALYAIAIVNIPFFARNVRGIAVTLKRREFIDAAQLSGKNNLQILFTEVLPNVLPVIVITLSTTIGWMILETAGLSFLGLGAQPPQADLGSMLGEGRKLIITAPHVSTIPGIMIFLIVMSINLLGDGIRDTLDPRLKAGALLRPASRTQTELPDQESIAGNDQGILNVNSLKTEFHTGSRIFKAVNSVDFQLYTGECLGVVGESGSGKSVTALSLLGLVASPPGKIVSGSVVFEDSDLLRISDRQLRTLRGGRISYIFQDPLVTLHPLYSVGEQLAEAILCHRFMSHHSAWKEAINLLDMVRIPNAPVRAKNYPFQLSGGMRQRVSIAMALANDPDILIADEPTTALDVTVQAEVLRLLRELIRGKDMSLIFITHDFGVIGQLCDRVVVMYAGKVVEQGSVVDVLTAPHHPYTRKLIECVPQLGNPDKKLVEIPGLPPAMDNLPDGCAFAPRCDLVQDQCRGDEIVLETLESGRKVRCRRVMEVVAR